MTEQRKAVIKNADMSEDMQQDAVDIASQALAKYNIEKVRPARHFLEEGWWDRSSGLCRIGCPAQGFWWAFEGTQLHGGRVRLVALVGGS